MPGVTGLNPWLEAAGVSGIAFALCDGIAQYGQRVVNSGQCAHCGTTKITRTTSRTTINADGEEVVEIVEIPTAAEMEMEHPDYDAPRTARFALLGAAYGPFLYTYYMLLDRHFGSNVLGKCLFDFFVYNPLMASGFIVLNCCIKDGHCGNVPAVYKSQAPTMTFVACTFWGLFDIFNFSLVPLSHQVLTTRVAGIIFDTYMAHAANQFNEAYEEIAHHHQEEEELKHQAEQKEAAEAEKDMKK
eukprot:PhM_4_TR2947/c0_g1_i1/m.13931/K13348/MPV17; protein Mpv17